MPAEDKATVWRHFINSCFTLQEQLWCRLPDEMGNKIMQLKTGFRLVHLKKLIQSPRPCDCEGQSITLRITLIILLLLLLLLLLLSLLL